MFNTRIAGISLRRLFWIGVIVLIPILLLLAGGQELHSQENQVDEIASENFQFAGHIDQDGAEFTAYGYVYDIEGIAPQELFSDSDPVNGSEETAHFTYYATADLTSRAVVTDAVRGIFALDSIGEITYYYQESPAASFDDPDSFAQGTAVTTATTDLQDILTVQEPNRGLAEGQGEITVLSVEPFTFGGETVQFGRPDKIYRVSTFGDAVRTDPVTPESSVLLAGDAAHIPFWQSFLPAVN
ncbi:MAG: hypothetical protein ACOC9Z_07775 [Chloroflexota bacterium]